MKFDVLFESSLYFLLNNLLITTTRSRELVESLWQFHTNITTKMNTRVTQHIHFASLMNKACKKVINLVTDNSAPHGAVKMRRVDISAAMFQHTVLRTQNDHSYKHERENTQNLKQLRTEEKNNSGVERMES